MESQPQNLEFRNNPEHIIHGIVIEQSIFKRNYRKMTIKVNIIPKCKIPG